MPTGMHIGIAVISLVSHSFGTGILVTLLATHGLGELAEGWRVLLAMVAICCIYAKGMPAGLVRLAPKKDGVEKRAMTAERDHPLFHLMYHAGVLVETDYVHDAAEFSEERKEKWFAADSKEN
jgi:hypothetical protein